MAIFKGYRDLGKQVGTVFEFKGSKLELYFSLREATWNSQGSKLLPQEN